MMNPASDQLIVSQYPKNCQTYFDLMVKVGSKGIYQWLLTFIFGTTWFVTGSLLLSTSFIYLNPTFDCEAFGLLTDNCYDYVCSLPSDQWPTFITQDGNSFKSLANSFDPYFCDDQFYLNLYATSVYFGALLGYITINFFADNYGRRKVTIISWSIGTLGSIILLASQSIEMASIGLFLCGFGTDAILGVTYSVMVQTYDDYIRQKHGTVIQGAFTAGAMVVTLYYYLWQNWKISTIFGVVVPSTICLILLIIFMKQSPMFLIKNDPEDALKVLNTIGKMNKSQQNCLTMKDIQDVMAFQESTVYNKVSTFADIFRYPSLRGVTIAQGVVSVSTYLIYYGPILIIGQFGFDIYTSNIVLNVADILTYYPLMLIINKIRRRTGCMLLFFIATLVSGVLIFLVKPKNCDTCSIIFIQLALIFVFRFCVSMQFSLMLIYQSEIYPTRVRNIGNGLLGVFGTMTSTVSPIFMGLLTRAGINHFILFTCLGIIAIRCFMVSPETFQKICPEEIEEIQFEKRNKSAIKTQLDHQKLHKY